MKRISLIAAIAENNAIGKDNKMLWHLPDDFRYFKRITTGCDVIMGKKTFFSLPVRPLPNRKNIVISGSSEVLDGCVMASSLENAIEKMDPEKENFIIGGGSVYEQFLPLAQKLYITKVHKQFEGDTFFPEFSHDDWTLISSEEHPADEKHVFNFTFLVYKRNAV